MLILFNGICAFAQNLDKINALREELAKANTDSKKYAAYNNLAWEFRSGFPDSAIRYSKMAYDLGLKLKRRDLAKALNFIGVSYYHKGDNLVAYDFYKEAVKWAEANDDSLQLGHAYNNLGRLFQEQGMMQKSLNHLQIARAIFSAIPDSVQSLGGYYKLNKLYKDSETQYKHALSIRLTIKSDREIISAYLLLGKLYLETKQVDLALKQFNQADSLADGIHDDIAQAETKMQIAECLMTKGSLQEAERMGLEGLNRIMKAGNNRLLPEANLIMGQIYQNKGDEAKARKYFANTVNAATTRNDLNTRMEAYFFLWQANRAKSSPSLEFEYYSKYVTLKDSVQSMEARQREAQLNFQFEIQKRDAENRVLRAKTQRKTAVIAGLAVLIISVLIILYLVVRNRRRILRINKLLEDRNNQIKRMNGLLRHKNIALEGHMNTLSAFSKNKSVTIGNLAMAAKDIVSITAKKLKISQVSIWIYNNDEKRIETLACYRLDGDSYRETQTILYADAPAYFEAIKAERIIVAHEARTHAATREFTERYFIPNNIYSLLDVSFFLDNQLKGVLCCEHMDKVRQWTAEDKLFVSSVADIITLSFRAAQRLEYEHQIKDQSRKIGQMNEALELKVKQRTEELEKQNHALREYAFINSHMLRGPLSRVLGLINILAMNKSHDDANVLELLRKSSDELDQIVRKITMAIDSGMPLRADELRNEEGQ
jgi:hypothetical protein